MDASPRGPGVNWQPRALAREAVRNVASSAWRTAALVGGIGLLLGALAALDLRDADDLRSFQSDFASSGGYVALGIPAAGSGPGTAALCDALGRAQGVVAAGAVYPGSLVSFASAPGVLFQSVPVTPGILDVWDPGGQITAIEGRQLLVGEALAEELGLRRGSYAVPRGQDPAQVGGIVDAANRNPQVSRWAFELTPPEGRAEQCWVEFEPETYDAGLAALPALLTTGDEPAAARPYFRTDEFTRNPVAEFAARPQRDGWPLASALVAGMFALTAWFRRSELGLYLAVGTSRTALAFMLAVEAAILVLAGLALGLAYAFAIDGALRHSPGWSEALLVLRSAGSAAVLGLVLAPLLALAVVRGSIADLLKDR